MKEDFSLQFSTKYIDRETNLYYYGYRFYNPKMGNWLSREPMGESESVNLYTFINNDSINYIDILGLALYAFDGTNNLPSDYTNVWLMAGDVQKGYTGKTFYLKGVGNSDEYMWGLRNVRQATGWGVDGKVDKMLELMRNHINKTGDTDVDIVGFSRGSVEASKFSQRIAELKKAGVKFGEWGQTRYRSCKYLMIKIYSFDVFLKQPLIAVFSGKK